MEKLKKTEDIVLDILEAEEAHRILLNNENIQKLKL